MKVEELIEKLKPFVGRDLDVEYADTEDGPTDIFWVEEEERYKNIPRSEKIVVLR